MIGFIGDSWIDTYNDTEHSWPALVSKKLDMDADYLGMSGTSHWFAYQKFLENYKKYKIIVFSHANYTRYPCIPNSEGFMHWNTGHVKTKYESDFFNKVNPYYMDLFPDNFLNFLCGKIYEDVNHICKDNDIFLVNVIPYSVNYNFKNTEFPILHKLYEVSLREKIKSNGKQIPTFDYIGNNTSGKDFRFCHFNFPNNILVSNIIVSLIKEKQTNKILNLLKFPFTVFDEKVDEIIGNLK